MKGKDIFFTKLVASGNDFVLLDNMSGQLDGISEDYGYLATKMCRRHLSIGADGLLVLETSLRADLRMRIINPDGTEVDMCGNGARCAAYWASGKNSVDNLVMETGAGLIGADIEKDRVKLKMSDPCQIKLGINLGLGKKVMTLHSLDSGVPHVVCLVDDLDGFPVVEMGKKIREHNAFAPDGTNVNFVAMIGEDTVDLRTYERGVEAETLSCGTGTVASAVVLGLLGQAVSPVRVKTRSGEILTVYFKLFPGHIVKGVYLEGPSRKVFEGKIRL